MSYKCSICENSVPSGLPMLRHLTYKDDGNIAKEMPVCSACKAGFRAGYSLEEVRRFCAPKKEMPEPLKHLPKPNTVKINEAPTVTPLHGH